MAAVQDVAADEARLAERAIAGDGNAFAELYGRYEKRAYNLCLRILGSEDEAADATQDAFVNVLRRLPKLEGRELAFGSYLFTSARHACYDLIEQRKRAEPTEEPPEPTNGEPGDPEDDPERNLLLEASQEEIRRANAELPERQREVLALRELEELSYDEIAEIMDMNRNSVAQLISRARINLRDALRGTALATVAAVLRGLRAGARAARGAAGPRGRRGRGLARPSPRWTATPAASAARRWRRPASPTAPGRRWRPRRCSSARRWRRPPRPWAPTGATWAEDGRGRRVRRHVARDVALIGTLTLLVLLFVALAAKTHDAAPGHATPFPRPRTHRRRRPRRSSARRSSRRGRYAQAEEERRAGAGRERERRSRSCSPARARTASAAPAPQRTVPQDQGRPRLGEGRRPRAGRGRADARDRGDAASGAAAAT